ncbi:MAG: hypothetical protein M3173_06255 [Chloroflexota bacterium]|nr:hypothetical protein [Chloroflexota bacterium]
MTSDDHDQQSETDLTRETSAIEAPGRLSRREVLGRSVLGITGAGLVFLLAACGGEEEDEALEDVDDQEEDEAADVEEDENPTGIEDLDEAPAGEDPAPGGNGG